MMMDTLEREKLIKYQAKYEGSMSEHYHLNLMMMSKTGFKWIELLETEFDKRFVELNFFLNQFNENETSSENGFKLAKNSLNEISSIFTQLAHKTLVVLDQNNKLEKDLENSRKDLKFARSECEVLKLKFEENNQQTMSKQNELINFATQHNSLNRVQPTAVHSINSTRLLSHANRVMSLSNVSNISSNSNLFNIKCNYSKQNLKDGQFSEIYANEEIRNLRDDNVSLKKDCISLKSELFGTKLAVKYLNKELSGRIQQIQILSKSDITKVDQSRLWNQIETEIYLSRHKTVITACRGRGQIVFGVEPNSPEIGDYQSVSRKNHGICEIRRILVTKKDNEGLGISITGGKEYGLPIIISEIHKNTPAARCGKLYIGDSILSVNGIDLNDVKHTEAARILLDQVENCELECVFVLSEFDENETVKESDTACQSYFDSRIMHYNDQQDHQQSSKSNLIDLRNTSAQCENGSEDDDFDNVSSITNTFSSPSKLYPGIAKLFTTAAVATTARSSDSRLREDESDNYDEIKLQTMDGCQIFHKNKSTIIN